MTNFLKHIKALISLIPSQKEQDEAYLNASVDNFDLERRMYELDHRKTSQVWYAAAMTVGVH